MQLKRHYSIYLLSPIIVFLSFIAIKDDHIVATVQYKIGSVSLIRSGKKVENIAIGEKLFVNDLLETKSSSRAELSLANGSVIKVRENSLFRIDKSKKVDDDKRSSFSLLFGKIVLKVKKLFSSTDEFSVKTPIAVVAIRGTEFSIEVTKENVGRIKVKEGVVDVGETEILRNFDSFAEWLKRENEMYKVWKEKQSGKNFFEEHYKLYEQYKKSQEDAFERFKRGEDIKVDDDKSWLETVYAGEEILLQEEKRIKIKADNFDEFDD